MVRGNFHIDDGSGFSLSISCRVPRLGGFEELAYGGGWFFSGGLEARIDGGVSGRGSS